jgi:RNA polymerase sigma-70 factor (ECF subfamily)
MGESDENVMRAVRNGDVEKLGLLFERHHRALFDFFAKMTGSRAIAEDLVQDVFFRILKYRNTFQAESRFKTWMFHIARNVRVDYYKKHGSERPAFDDSEEELHGSFQLPSQALELDERTKLLECALFRLPPEKREILILSRYQEMKYEEIAQLLGCEPGTVKVRIYRAMKELRDIFFKLSKQKPLCAVKKSVNNLRSM